ERAGLDRLDGRRAIDRLPLARLARQLVHDAVRGAGHRVAELRGDRADVAGAIVRKGRVVLPASGDDLFLRHASIPLPHAILDRPYPPWKGVARRKGVAR